MSCALLRACHLCTHQHCNSVMCNHYPNLVTFMQPSDEKEGMPNMRVIPELNYMTQIIFLLFEDTSQPENSDLRYCVDILFSPGVRCRELDHLHDLPDANASPRSSSLEGSPRKSAPINSTVSNESGSNVNSHPPMLTKTVGDFEVPRPKELVHVVRRQPDQPYPPSTTSLWRKKSSTVSRVMAVQGPEGPVINSIDNGRGKSLSETEIFASHQRKYSVGSMSHAHGKDLGSCSKSLDTLVAADGMARLQSAPAHVGGTHEMEEAAVFDPTDDVAPVDAVLPVDGEDISNVSFKIMEDGVEEERFSPPGAQMLVNSNSILSSDKNLRNNSFGERKGQLFLY